MDSVRSALYLDFDNVFSGLLKLDPRLAMRFAEEPGAWVRALAEGGAGATPRRWLVLRCYMNPAGWVPHPTNDGSRLYFDKLRLPFTDAGFEVVDCPRLSHTKNGADIRMVIDAVEALRADVRYDEFVIASGDSDMTPLLVRLRASDRRTTLLSPSDSAVVLGSVADRLVGGEELAELLSQEPADLRGVLGTSAGDELGQEEDAIGGGALLTEAEAKAHFEERIRSRYAEATEPLYLTQLAVELRRELGSVVDDTRWFGYNGFGRALQALQLPDVRMSHYFLWDAGRHEEPPSMPPVPEHAVIDRSSLPGPVARVAQVLKLPPLPEESWRRVHVSLAAFVASYEFDLNEATRWSRDRLAEAGVRVSRQAVSLVAKGAAYGGCPLYRRPPPAAHEIASAFVANVIDRARAADIDLSEADEAEVRAWFGAPQSST